MTTSPADRILVAFGSKVPNKKQFLCLNRTIAQVMSSYTYQESYTVSPRSTLVLTSCQMKLEAISNRSRTLPWTFLLLHILLAVPLLPCTDAWVCFGSATASRRQSLLTTSKRLNQQPQQQENDTSDEAKDLSDNMPIRHSGYNLGIGKNRPLVFSRSQSDQKSSSEETTGSNSTNEIQNVQWHAPLPVQKPLDKKTAAAAVTAAAVATASEKLRRTRKVIARNEEARLLRGAIWHEQHFDASRQEDQTTSGSNGNNNVFSEGGWAPKKPALAYPDIDLSIPESVYSDSTDMVWDLMRWEAFQEAQREPLLVSFLHSTILNHRSLESSLAFLLANRLSSPAMISTQIQSLILEAFCNNPSVGRCLRADIMAVRDRDPACTCLPDVFLYFKGFHALQTYRVAHALWKADKRVLAHFLQSQMSQRFQIDIHPNATLGSGIMLDHGTGIVIGETARVGNNCSILHHVTLGGSGKKGVDRHPKVGDGKELIPCSGYDFDESSPCLIIVSS